MGAERKGGEGQEGEGQEMDTPLLQTDRHLCILSY